MSEPFDIVADVDHARIARVVWVDSGLQVYGGWRPEADILSEHMGVKTVESVGYWIGENENVIALAQTRDPEEGDLLNIQVILKTCITRKEWL